MEAEAFRVSAEEETEAELSPVPVVLQEVAATAKSRAQIRMEAIRLTFFIFNSSFEGMVLLVKGLAKIYLKVLQKFL